MNATVLTMLGPVEMSQSLAHRLRALRLLKAWTQTTLAARAGVTVASLRRFEVTGKASLELVLKISHALDRLEELEQLFQPPPAQSIEELERRATRPTRKRGRR
jgi:transcriptional regulator with XRE-family HTH domain